MRRDSFDTDTDTDTDTVTVSAAGFTPTTVELKGLSTIRPGQAWLDTKGERIQAHGGSVMEIDGTFYWYGENKEKTTPGSGIWHWGVRLYSSQDLCNWVDEGIIIAPEPDDGTSPLHPAQMVDRPHIVRSAATGKLVCWLKIMEAGGSQRSTVLTADDIRGPWSMVRTGLRPLGMNAGDFDLVIDPHDGKGYYYFERVHSELICADLTEDCTDVTGYYSTHFPLGCPPWVREAPAYFSRRGKHYLLTSGTSGYFPNPSQLASAPTYHGPWTVLGDPHVNDPSETSFNSQISSVFKHPGKKDLYIAVADRWLPELPQLAGEWFTSGALSRAMRGGTARRFDPEGVFGTPPEVGRSTEEFPMSVPQMLGDANTSIADYVWLPLRFEGEMAYLDWTEEWCIDDFE